MARGTLWTNEEISCLMGIWADQKQLDNTHKNAEMYGVICEYMSMHGFNRTAEQCRVKVKRMKTQYHKVKDLMRKSGSSADEKDKLPWFDEMDSILGHKPASEPDFLESHPSTQSSLTTSTSSSAAASPPPNPASESNIGPFSPSESLASGM